MIQFFITGTSSGIGYQLAMQALEDGHKVVGISRRHVINHPNYRHLTYNLNNYDEYKLINFNINKEAEKLVLVNNAGWLGDVKPAGQVSPASIERAYQINLIAPSILSKLFIEQTEKLEAEKVIVNISSGAASYPVSGWSTYCASKAGINLFTQVLREDYPNIHSFAIAPGIVDTDMQGEIRRLDTEDFPDKQRFVDYKDKGELSSPIDVASKLLKVIKHPETAPDCVFSLRDT
ncbi:SDR family NAD(P)-dependent oxidoreductase [Owenweeksia hongkongensis]|uniref:SDR family NAD(P)-dependent oxidoreductase n=1 Tax=Owenweeksia hongkongensis TaxID=253245 RepID=UPI003A8DB209